MATPCRLSIMTEKFAYHTVSPGLHRVTGHAAACAALVEPRLKHWMLREGAPTPFASATARWLDAMDPKSENPTRKTVIQALGTSAIATLVPCLQDCARGLIERFPDQGAIDIYAAYARPITYRMVADVLGVAEDERARLDPMLDALEPQIIAALFPMVQRPYDAEFFAAWQAMIIEVSGSTGLIARLQQDLEGSNAAQDLGAFTAMFAFAATSNISRFIAQAAIGFAVQPGLYQRLREDPAQLGPALEEWLRYEPPLNFVHLVAAEPLDEGRIARGDSVLVSLTEANRDERVFPRACEFEPSRRTQHLSFGHGALTCIGASFARILARISLLELTGRFSPTDARTSEFPMLYLTPIAKEGQT